MKLPQSGSSLLRLLISQIAFSGIALAQEASSASLQEQILTLKKEVAIAQMAGDNIVDADFIGFGINDDRAEIRIILWRISASQKCPDHDDAELRDDGDDGDDNGDLGVIRIFAVVRAGQCVHRRRRTYFDARRRR